MAFLLVGRNFRPGIEQCAGSRAPVDERNPQGQTPLLVAVWNNDVQTARRLIEAGAGVNAKNRISDSPFLVAGVHGRIEILCMILAHGADLRSTNRFGGTALIPAAEKGHAEAVDMLIATGVDVDHVNKLGWTALLEAVSLSDGRPVHQRIVRVLLDAGANRDIPDFDGKTALDHACSPGIPRNLRHASRALARVEPRQSGVRFRRLITVLKVCVSFLISAVN